jgi:hypothetical protein
MEQDLDDGQVFVRISNRQIYNELTRLTKAVDKLESRVDNVLSENVDLRKRTRALELRSYGIMAGLLGAVVVLLKIGSFNIAWTWVHWIRL